MPLAEGRHDCDVSLLVTICNSEDGYGDNNIMVTATKQAMDHGQVFYCFIARNPSSIKQASHCLRAQMGLFALGIILGTVFGSWDTTKASQQETNKPTNIICPTIKVQPSMEIRVKAIDVVSFKEMGI